MDHSSQAVSELAGAFASLVRGLRWVLVGAVAVSAGIACLLVSAAPRVGKVFEDMVPPGEQMGKLTSYAVDHTGAIVLVLALVGATGMFLTATNRRPDSMVIVAAFHVLLLTSFGGAVAVMLLRALARIAMGMTGP